MNGLMRYHAAGGSNPKTEGWSPCIILSARRQVLESSRSSILTSLSILVMSHFR